MSLEPATPRPHPDHPAPGGAGPPERAVAQPLRLVDNEPAPDGNLLVYYALTSLLLGPFFWIILIPKFFRFRTLRYRFDDEGVTMRWGILFRKEISLTYARIQDIHLNSNVVERWLGLARIQVQTASGNAGAEMTIEGLREFEQVRDFLYLRMRGAREQGQRTASRGPTPEQALPPGAASVVLGPEALAELTLTLREVAGELRELRAAVGRDAPSREVPHA